MPKVIKANGEAEEFSEKKLIDSINRAGIPADLQEEVVQHIKSNLYDNIPTHEIYYHLEEFLGHTKSPYYKNKYSLKRALMDLGPTGFPFEAYVAEILKAQGFTTSVGEILMGKCVNHEVDIIATNKTEKIMVECKFHNRPGTRSDVQVALYTKARFDDLKEKHGFTGVMLATNTKITVDALAYSDCNNIKVLSWEHPEGESLRELVEKYKLFPVTSLSFLSMPQKQELLAKNVVLVKDICENPDLINQISIPINKREEILGEAKRVCMF